MNKGLTKKPGEDGVSKELAELRRDQVLHDANQKLIDRLTRLLLCVLENLIAEVEKLRVAAVTCPISPMVSAVGSQPEAAVEGDEAGPRDEMVGEPLWEPNLDVVSPQPEVSIQTEPSMVFMDEGREEIPEVLMVDRIAYLLNCDRLFVVDVVEEVIQKASDKLIRDMHADKCIELVIDLVTLLRCRDHHMFDEVYDILEKEGLVSPPRESADNSPPRGLSPYNNAD